MSIYRCEFCDVILRKASYKQRRIHNRGKTHILMRKAYYLELLEEETIRTELNRKITRRKSFSEPFELPPGMNKNRPIVPKIPENIKSFVLPSGFDFKDKRNYPKEWLKIKKVIDGDYF